jgi:hypothetical protein
MTRLAFILILLGCTGCQHEPLSSRTPFPRISPEWTGLSMCSFWDTNYLFQCPTSQAYAQPKWTPEQDYPPLTPWKAKAAALAQARLIRPDITEWECLEIALACPDTGQSFYVVTFAAGDRFRTGVIDHLKVPVLMSGETVQVFTEATKK